jgi:type IV fimbrial biogenesis protein FimT
MIGNRKEIDQVNGMKKLTKSQHGITLIELLSTVVIIGIVSAMAVPRFQVAVERVKFRSANRDIVSTMRLARSLAVSDKQQYGVYFDGAGWSETYSSGLTYTLFKDLDNPANYSFDAGDSVIRIDTLPSEFVLLITDITNDAVIFLPNGSAGFTGGGNIVTMASTEDLIAILDHNVLASTGRIRSSSYYY